MSGPIIRKYGFPNFESIFGARPLEHGVEKPEEAQAPVPKTDPKSDGKAPVEPGKTQSKR